MRLMSLISDNHKPLSPEIFLSRVDDPVGDDLDLLIYDQESTVPANAYLRMPGPWSCAQRATLTTWG